MAVERRLGPAEFRWDAWDMGRRALRVCLSRIWKLPDPTRGGLLSRLCIDAQPRRRCMGRWPVCGRLGVASLPRPWPPRRL